MSLFFHLYKALEKLNTTHHTKEIVVMSDGAQVELDQTGRVSDQSKAPKTYFNQGKELVFSEFDNSIAHSFWRSQELSIFYRIKKEFHAPVLDFGCGDGSFASCIYESIDYGVDIDIRALSIARKNNVYRNLLIYDEMKKSIPSQSISTVISCSVLEHVADLKDCLDEIYRVLKNGGKLYLTAPNENFITQMRNLIDEDFEKKMNKKMYHRNLFNKSEWEFALINAGFRNIKFSSFQPLIFTKIYFALSLLGRRAFGRLPGVRAIYLFLYRKKLMNLVGTSIAMQNDGGANYFIVAEK